MDISDTEWGKSLNEAMEDFASRYAGIYSISKKNLSAHFEVGCFLSLINFYEEVGFEGKVENSDEIDSSYKYLTTPCGNPNKFSYMQMSRQKEIVEIRQQVRIVSHLGGDIAFTPDLVVVGSGVEIKKKRDPDYANGERDFFYIKSCHVIAIHECKSLRPYQELLVSFIGMVVVGHSWFKYNSVKPNGDHLAPTLFVGGRAHALLPKMIGDLKKIFPINIVTDLHSGNRDLSDPEANNIRIGNPFCKKDPTNRVIRIRKENSKRYPCKDVNS